MNAPLNRNEWVQMRVIELMADDTAVAELIDEIQRHNGLASRALRAHLLAWIVGETVFVRERAADAATNLVSAFALMRATREYNQIPLAGAPRQ